MDTISLAASAPRAVDQRDSRDYRADIDGLRAIAVLTVVAFHLGFARSVPGGFIGVDIFFVISGYLIGGALLRDIRQRRYDILDFYVRRFRRIVPALAVVLLATTIAMALTAFPKELVHYGKSLASATLSVSNFYFWSNSNYFDSASESNPLLHTWSLAVEEQFYILFPLLMLPLRHVGERALTIALGAIALVSLVASAIATHAAPEFAFYLLPTRAWELLLGTIAAAVQYRLPLQAKPAREATAALGLVLALVPVLLYSEKTPFPGLAALPPCLGTAMLLVAGAQGTSLAGKALSTRPMTFFGLISYSLYLWHWPVIVLTRQWLPAAVLDKPTRLILFAAATGLAWLSWRLVERPWRSPLVSRRIVFRASAAAGILFCTLGAALVLSGGFPQRFDPHVLQIAGYDNDSSTNDFRTGRCFISSRDGFADFDRATCLRTDPGRPNLLILGDSHAAHLWAGMAAAHPRLNFLQGTASGCKPLIAPGAHDAERCRKLMQFLFDDYLKQEGKLQVLLAASWDEEDLAPLAATLDGLRARHIPVIVAGPIVRYQLPLPQLVALATTRGKPAIVDALRQPDGAALDSRVEAVARQHGAGYFSTWRALCGPATCATTTADGMPLQFDYGHLTRAGSLLVARSFPESLVATPR